MTDSSNVVTFEHHEDDFTPKHLEILSDTQVEELFESMDIIQTKDFGDFKVITGRLNGEVISVVNGVASTVII